MPDPAILSLLQHLMNPPPAIVWQAPIPFVGPLAIAFETLVADRERESRKWINDGLDLQTELHETLKHFPDELNYSALSHVIEQLERDLRKQSKLTARIALRKNQANFDQRLHLLSDRLLTSQYKLYEAGLDFVLFLRAMRAEVSPTSRGGPSFDNPDDLEKYILAQVA